jgi:hypothetical protein
MHEHELNIELMGAERPAVVQYEPDPADGYPRITAVEIGRAIDRSYDPSGAFRPHVEHITLDILPLLDEADLLRLEQGICEARPIWREAA